MTVPMEDDGPGEGLTGTEAQRRLLLAGPNELPRARPRSALSRVVVQLRDPMMAVLLVTAVVTVILRDAADTLVVALVMVLNTTLGVHQERRAERAVEAIDALTSPTAVVVRDGLPRRVAGRDVVPGDLLLLRAGDVVAADADVVEAHALQVDESTLTGESWPRERRLGDETSAGTVVVRGRGRALVTRTGSSSALGRVAAAVRSGEARATPLQRRLRTLSGQIVLVVSLVATVVLGLGVWRGEPLGPMLLVALSLAVAAVPESLPAVVSVTLALGAHRMARHRAVAKNLAAVETLGSVTVLASDKTGTLTEGRIRVHDLWFPGRAEVVSEHPAGEGTLVGPARLLRDVALCNDASTVAADEAEDGWRGDPLERALLEAVVDSGSSAEEERLRWPRVAEVPFDPAQRAMTTVHRDTSGRWLVVVKGAPDVVLPRVPEAERPDALRRVAEQAEAGHRVLAVADATVVGERPDPDSVELSLAGLVALGDRPRPTAARLVTRLASAGIALVLVTGDQGSTARVIAGRIGLLDEGALVVDGRPADDLTASELARVRVFARTRPDEKVAVVELLERAGHVVAVTGDGVNDAPALRRADIGVAMGGTGSEVARQAADLVLMDDDLETVVVAVAEGRRIHTNIRTFLAYGLSGGLAEVLVMLVGPFVGMPVPLLPAQILWINMLTHGLPGVAFGAEPADPADMERPPRAPTQSILADGLAAQVAWTGALLAAVALGAAAVGHVLGGSERSAIFVALGAGQLGIALALRSPGPRGPWRSRGVEAAVAAAFVLQLAAVLPGVRELLHTQPLSWLVIAALMPLAVLPAVVVRLSVARRRAGSTTSPPERGPDRSRRVRRGG